MSPAGGFPVVCIIALILNDPVKFLWRPSGLYVKVQLNVIQLFIRNRMRVLVWIIVCFSANIMQYQSMIPIMYLLPMSVMGASVFGPFGSTMVA
ncbi:hypothetical protein B1F79_01430 [Coxiella-like endosymbiont of Rhipicephalus sanguineus]|nr:hypothetical protein [Coxiella-like endosymbiont of Rhipicephalus sanguineus]